MNRGTKVNILYQIAMGQPVNLSKQERAELSKYKVAGVGKPFTTKSNISQYVSAVDRGYRKEFYDWCLDNHKGDRRTKGGSAESIKLSNFNDYIGIMLLGWMFWGVALYWILGEIMRVEACAIMGAIVSVALFRLKRKWVFFTCFLLPIILASVFGSR